MIHMSFAGRLGRDAELRQTNGGDNILSMAVAVDIGFGDNKKTQWMDCSLFGKRAESLSRYLSKGSQVTIWGTGELHAYTDRSGNARTAIRVRVNEIALQGGGQRSNTSPSGSAPKQNGGSDWGQPQGDNDFSDDVPF